MSQDRVLNNATDEPGVPLTEDMDGIVHRKEDGRTPPAMPPESEADFEKAIRGEDGVPGIHIPPANPD
jgi:hypothetical protein